MAGFQKSTIYKWVLGLGIISLPILFLAIILLIYNINAKTGKYKLILLLIISTFFCTLSYILPWKEPKGEPKGEPKSTLCSIQGNLMLMFETSQYLLSMLVGYHTRFVILFNKGSDTRINKVHLFTYIFVGYGIPLILVIIANLTKMIGYCSPWCWILDGNNELSHAYRVIVYLIMIGSQVLNIFFSMSIFKNLNYDSFISVEQKTRDKSLVCKMLGYPICLLVCIIPGLINRIASFGKSQTDEGMSWLSSLAIIMLCSSGFFILILYGMILNIYRLLKESCNKTVTPDEEYYSVNEISET